MDVSVEPHHVRERARAAVTRALQLDPSSGEVHLAMAVFLNFLEWDWAGAERHYIEALRLTPGDTFAHQWYGSLLSAMGRVEEGVVEGRKALALNPKASQAVWPAGERLVQAGLLDEARRAYEQAIQMKPPSPWALLHLGAYVYAQQDPPDLTKAQDVISKAMALFGYPYPDRVTPLVEALGGNTRLRREATAVLEDIVAHTALKRIDVFWCYVRVASKGLFFELVEEAVRRRHPWVPWIPVMIAGSVPELTADPRWGEFLAKIRHPGTDRSWGRVLSDAGMKDTGGDR